MAEKDFIRAGGMVILGLLSAVIGLLILIMMIPQMKIAGGSSLIAVFLFLIIWLVIYVGLIVCAMVVRFFGPVGRAPAKRAKRKKKKRRKR